MKKAVFISLFFLTGFCLFAQQESAYYEVGALNYDLNKNVASVMERLENAGFKVIGQYFPGNSGNLAVVCYTHPELEKIALEYTDRGALGATLKIGFKKNENVVCEQSQFLQKIFCRKKKIAALQNSRFGGDFSVSHISQFSFLSLFFQAIFLPVGNGDMVFFFFWCY